MIVCFWSHSIAGVYKTHQCMPYTPPYTVAPPPPIPTIVLASDCIGFLVRIELPAKHVQQRLGRYIRGGRQQEKTKLTVSHFT